MHRLGGRLSLDLSDLLQEVAGHKGAEAGLVDVGVVPFATPPLSRSRRGPLFGPLEAAAVGLSRVPLDLPDLVVLPPRQLSHLPALLLVQVLAPAAQDLRTPEHRRAEISSLLTPPAEPAEHPADARSGRSVGRFRVSVHSTRFEVSGWGSPGSRVSCRQYAATPENERPGAATLTTITPPPR